MEKDNMVDCKFCGGKGLLNPNHIPNFNFDDFKKNGGHILDIFTIECWVCGGSKLVGHKFILPLGIIG